MEAILTYLLSFAHIVKDIGAWVSANPGEAAIIGGLIAELIAKYSPWKGADGLIEIMGKAILRSARK